MGQIIKNKNFVNIRGNEFTPTPPINPTYNPGISANSKPLLIQGARRIGIETKQNYTPEIREEPIKISEEEERKILLEEEFKELREKYHKEALQIKETAVLEAKKITDTAEEESAKLREENRIKCIAIEEETKKSAYDEGYQNGYDSGSEKGYNDGYDNGLKKCKDTLKELISMLDKTAKIKEEIFKNHEHELFDAIFTISNKIIIDSLKQKDKAILQKMLSEAAKGFRNSEFIKVSLSKLDVEDMGDAEMDALREVFRESQHVEFEIIKDASNGTLILDNGSEITDASIATQLMMIENIGKGKFRDKPPE